jgi:serine/threonine-protein kinase
MLVGQKLGPFLIEKELGAGAMGAVYRGKYIETGQVVAVKIMAPGLGSSGNNAAERFQRESKILKQLKHPNIVAHFGAGRHQGTFYYAMEYIQGESLDRVMARRDRMTWEEVVALGQQLCSALQHAHEKGIIHRDLKPSNLMILQDGTLKLTDFGIAKDIDLTALTKANNTIGTASYMSPEQCRGEKDISYKSDLYSLGVVFYELITGRKPFVAENAMDLFLMHVNGTFERPSRLVLDLPVWMDNLICQLLEKKPEHRPHDAAMVAQVLGSIQDKVEAQQSAGVDAVKARRIESPRGKRNPDKEDREAARTLLGRPRGKRKKKKGLHQMVWVQAVGLALLLAGVIGVLVIAVRPPSADSLYRQAEKLMASDNPDKHTRAREGPIAEYLSRYGELDTPQTNQVRRWADDYDVARYEKLLARHVRHEKKKVGLAVEARTEAERLAFKAALAEQEGNADEAVKLWKQVAEEDPVRVGLLAKRHLERFDSAAAQKKQLSALRDEVRLNRSEPQLDDFRKAAFLGLRHEKLGDRRGALRRYERLKEEADREASDKEADQAEEQRLWSLYAALHARRLKDSLKEKLQDDKERVELVRKTLEKVRKAIAQRGVSLLEQRAVAHDVELLYDKETDLAEQVKEAKALVGEIDSKLPRRPR